MLHNGTTLEHCSGREPFRFNYSSFASAKQLLFGHAFEFSVQIHEIVQDEGIPSFPSFFSNLICFMLG